MNLQRIQNLINHFNMKKIVIFNILIILLSVSNIMAQQGGTDRCMPVRDIPQEELVFKGEEILTYIASYEWGAIKTDVGSATLNLKYIADAKRPYFHSKLYGKTDRLFDRMFKVRDFYESKFYADNMRPKYFHRDISEGKYKMKNTFIFNDSTYEILSTTERQGGAPVDTLLKGRICTFDLLSLYHFARNLDFSKMELDVEQPISFAVDDEIFELYYRILGREMKKVPGLGTFNTIKFAARLVAGEVFSGKEEMIIWVSDDKNCLPLYFESPIIVGKVTGRLSYFKDLKFPLTSKIK